MSNKEEIYVKSEYEDSSFYYQDYKDEEKYEPIALHESSGELTTIKTPKGDYINVYLRLGNRILFCSGKYFSIDRTTEDTDHQKEYTGIVTTCYTCGVQIRGSLKVSSNFISHLKARHPKVYHEFLKQKQEANTGTKGKLDKLISGHRTSPYPSNAQIVSNILQKQESPDLFQRNILQFLIATNQPLSLVEDIHFLKLFEFPLKKSYQYEQMIKDDCKDKQMHLANFFNNTDAYICLTSDVWTFGDCKYLGLSCHWIDDQFERKTAFLACIRSSILEGKCLRTLQSDILFRYGFQKHNIVKTLTENIQNYTNDFMEFGINSEVLCFDNMETTEDYTFLKQLQGNLQMLNPNNGCEINGIQLDILRLNKIWGIEFIKHLDVLTKNLHQTFIEKCSAIWKASHSILFRERFDIILNGSIIRPNLLSFSSLYSSLKQLRLNKSQLSQMCVFLEKPTFSDIELEYLEELVDVFEPLNAAFVFLDMPQNNFFGCFLPTLVTLKWKLTRLYNSQKLKHLQQPLSKLKEQLLSEYKLYYELNDTKSEAILAAITYPPVKTRFLIGLQESVSCVNFQARNLLLKYGKDYHIGNDGHVDSSTMQHKQDSRNSSITTPDFFDFGDDMGSTTDDNRAPNTLKLEIDTYLADSDSTLSSLQKYPTIKQMFLRYNTCIPSPSSVLRLFPLQKILKTSFVSFCTHEQFEDYIFYQSYLLDK